MRIRRTYWKATLGLPLRSEVVLAVLCLLPRPTIQANVTSSTPATISTYAPAPEIGDGYSNGTVDYSTFSKILAGVLVLREGGVANATRAIPYLNAVTQQFLDTQLYLNTHPKIMKLIQNFTDFHSYKDNTDLLEKIEKHLKEKGTWLGKHIEKKKDKKLTAHIQEKINNAAAKLRPVGFDKDLAELNRHLAKFHIVIRPKQITAPTKFQNSAVALSSTVTALSAQVSGITWAPALVRYGHVGLGMLATGLSITPTALAVIPSLSRTAIQGVNIQPSLLTVGPEGVNIQPGGVRVAPNLFVVAPTGVNILPQGVAVGAAGFVEASTGVNVQTAGARWGPVNHIIP
eukprot:jgi/Botrbrau1/18129/Bobra.53_1s0007.1